MRVGRTDDVSQSALLAKLHLNVEEAQPRLNDNRRALLPVCNLLIIVWRLIDGNLTTAIISM